MLSVFKKDLFMCMCASRVCRLFSGQRAWEPPETGCPGSYEPSEGTQEEQQVLTTIKLSF